MSWAIIHELGDSDITRGYFVLMGLMYHELRTKLKRN